MLDFMIFKKYTKYIAIKQFNLYFLKLFIKINFTINFKFLI